MSLKNFSVYLNSKIKPYKKTITVDPDKSISIRGFLIGSICQGVSTVKNVLESEDVKSTIDTCKKLGVKINKYKAGHYKIFGKGLGSLQVRDNTKINFGNSGTLARLLIGLLSTNVNINLRIPKIKFSLNDDTEWLI